MKTTNMPKTNQSELTLESNQPLELEEGCPGSFTSKYERRYSIKGNR